MVTKRNKERVTGFVSPYIKRKMQELVISGEFGSESDLIATALTEWLRDRELSMAIEFSPLLAFENVPILV